MDTTIRLQATESGERLDRFVASKISDLSRSQVQRLIEQGKITVNGDQVKRSYQLRAGDLITVQIPPYEPPSLIPQRIEIRVIYEDEDLVVIDKPAGMVVHPAHGHADGTVVNALLARYPRLADQGGDLRPGIVHRLDKDTSGLLVIALSPKARLLLQHQFKEHLVHKVYLALVEGKLSPDRGMIEAPIGRDPHHRQRMSIVAKGGKEARTEYQVIAYLSNYSLLWVRPLTGRTHQIRVHLSSIGHPVAGDRVYGRRKSTHEGFPRQLLHAWRMSFLLPSTGERVHFEAPIPEDLQMVLDSLGGIDPSLLHERRKLD